MPETKLKRLEKMISSQGVIRSADLDRTGIPRNYLMKLARAGKLQKIAPGLYVTDEFAAVENVTLLDVTHRLSKAVVCLLSALRFHEIGTQLPHEVWIALPRHFKWNPKPGGPGHNPKRQYPPVRIVRFSDEAMAFGVQEHSVSGSGIKVFSPAKTVADCFKFRNKIGLEVALEALREAHRQKKATVNDIWEAAKVCRVTNVIRPYLESLQ